MCQCSTLNPTELSVPYSSCCQPACTGVLQTHWGIHTYLFSQQVILLYVCNWNHLPVCHWIHISMS